MKITPDGESFLIHPARSCWWCAFRHVGRDCPSIRGEALARIKLMCQGTEAEKLIVSDLRQFERTAKLVAAFDCVHYQKDIDW